MFLLSSGDSIGFPLNGLSADRRAVEAMRRPGLWLSNVAWMTPRKVMSTLNKMVWCIATTVTTDVEKPTGAISHGCPVIWQRLGYFLGVKCFELGR
jgi:hypothetical protein